VPRQVAADDSTPQSTASGASPGTSQSNASSSSTEAGGTTVDVKNFACNPDSLTVKTGATVIWKFEDSAARTVDFAQQKILSKALSNGATFSYKFTKPGTYDYICSIHP